MTDEVRVRAVRDETGTQVPGHWLTRCGYLVLPCRALTGPKGKGYAVIHRSEDAPFAYMSSEFDILPILRADRELRGRSA